MTPISKIKRRQLQLPMLLGVGALVLGIGGSILRDRMLTTQESADTKSIPMDALPVNETRTSEFIQPLASVIDDETASKLARRADPRMMSYMRDRPDLSGAGSTPPGKAELFFDATSQAQQQNGLPDGLKVLPSGIVLATGPGGVWVLSPQGEHVGTIQTGVSAANVALSSDNRWLYITATNYLLRIALQQ